ncbi:hypothetical protein KSF_012040 [Reticulibacter mediterranei]|uniref:Uncharacterized protein n=1 Tax=Reticulibacter mediterranei TaxID=2778369 RepID=A0A8J3IJ70_9CHLR|nr:hypothetical protein [Reticulibacter mediterranei]GHO91156.1 hypothetical protein KSF_012040 [Reticulibacter mediterranei]
MNNEQQDAIFRITARYVAEVQAGHEPVLSEYIARYPQYADSIADFVAYYHGFEATIPIASNVHTLLSPFSQVDLPCSDAQMHVEPLSTTTVTTLLATEQQHFTLSELARKLDLSVDIVALLEQRAIDPATLPFELYRRIALALHQPISSIQAYLSRTPQRSRPAREKQPLMKVAEKPAYYHVSGEQTSLEQSFRHIVAESLWLSPEQREAWEAILTLENL